MITENISTLKINKLTQAQYDRELAAGRIDENALYLTPDDTEVTPVEKGGTGATTVEEARTNLGITYGDGAPTTPPSTGEGSVYFFEDDFSPVTIEEGGTGATTREDAVIALLGYRPGYCKIVKKDDTTNYSTSYNYFDPLTGTVETTSNMGEHIYQDSMTFPTYGDRSNYTVTGIRIGANVNCVRVYGSVRYINNDDTNVAVHTIVFRHRADSGSNISQTIVGVNIGKARLSETFSTVIEVQEGDFIALQSYKGASSRDIDVLHTSYATQMCVEAIG